MMVEKNKTVPLSLAGAKVAARQKKWKNMSNEYKWRLYSRLFEQDNLFLSRYETENKES